MTKIANGWKVEGWKQQGHVKGRFKKTHGMTNTRTWQAWFSMRARCRNKNPIYIKYYQKKGITVTPKWETFETFLADMGECPDGFQLDRINPAKGYYKENCRWVNTSQQASNKGAKLRNKTRYKGVSVAWWNKNKFYTQIKHSYLGSFDTAEEAALAYNEAAKKEYGEYAYLNIIKKRKDG